MVRVSPKNDVFTFGHELLDLSTIKAILKESYKVKLSANAEKAVIKCRAYLDHKLAESDKPYYGINTGFGYLQHVRIDKSQIAELQYNLLRSHACGTGAKVPRAIIKLMLLLKVLSLAQGHSGVQLSTINRLLDFYNSGYVPVLYTQGSLGASGDLAPLSHLSLPLIGEGALSDVDYRILSSASILVQMGWAPIKLQAKEGLALINGTQFMSAYGIHCLLRMEHLLDLVDLIAALSCEAFNCNLEPFHPAIHQVRPHPGQQKVATTIWSILARSPIAQACEKEVQDPYSFRCIPQVHGASRDVYEYVHKTFIREINSVTDNPSIFPAEDLILSGGNFHGQPLAISLDSLGIALAELASISERRTFQLISGQRGLPSFLVNQSGLHSGLMIPQYTAASIVSQNKQLCSPASVDSIVSSNGQEDHVSMGANAATKCLQILENTERVLAIELLTATQALDLRSPMQSAPLLASLRQEYRRYVPFISKDRMLSTDIQLSHKFIQEVNLEKYANAICD